MTPTAHFLLAQALEGAGEPLSATIHYRAYLESGTAIAPYVQEWLGDALRAGGAFAESIAAYQAAVDGAPHLSFEVGIREKIALNHVALEDYDGALAQYDAILAQARIPAYRARIVHQEAQTLLLAGESEAGYDRHLELIEAYPTSSWAYQSLIVVVEAGIPISDLTRGIVDYYGGAYDAAVAALYRYIDTHPDHSGAAHYYAGLSHLAAGSPALAEGQFRTVVEDHPESDHWGDSWMGWAEALAEMGDVQGAADVYQEFAETIPLHARASEALWTAARMLERSGELERSAALYRQGQAAYPDSEYAVRALLRAGLQHYRMDDLDTAIADWEALTGRYADPVELAEAHLWLGKAYLAVSQPVSATAAFEQAIALAPADYFGLRAAELLADPLANPFPPSTYRPPTDPDEGRQEAEEWLAGWMGLSSSAGIGEPGTTLMSNPTMRRGLEFWRLGMWAQAKDEFEALRRATEDEPLTQYRLALLFRDLGLYRSSILAASTVIRYSPASGPVDAPPFLARLAYPNYFEDLLLANALAEDLPPLLVFSLVRRESLFESFATSSAYAHGLMQVIPSTGASIASQLGWPPGYETQDLYRPVVSARFGTWYLARQRDLFDGRLDAALAAYNGGPGNAGRWIEAAGEDPDLFFEMISLRETRTYVQVVREDYAVYSQLYGR
jgi:soluble lytic murein transglycosylase